MEPIQPPLRSMGWPPRKHDKLTWCWSIRPAGCTRNRISWMSSARSPASSRGIVVAIAEELKLPVRLIGVGESVEDLQDFQSDAFVDALLGPSTPSSAWQDTKKSANSVLYT